MIIALYFFIVNIAIPQLASYMNAMIEPVMTIVIVVGGIVLLFGAVGMRISENMGSTIVSGIFHAIGFICRTSISAIGWIIRETFMLMPRVFRGSKHLYHDMGASDTVSTLLGVLTALIVFIAIV